MNALGLVFSNIHDSNIPELTEERTMGSIPFCARYRLVDFALSSLVNSGITNVGLITKSNYQSLMDHVGSGKDWDLARRHGGLHILPPFGVSGNKLYTTRLEALNGAMNFLNHSDAEFVVMTDCDIVYSMDFNDVIKAHVDNNADITLVYVKRQYTYQGKNENTILLDFAEDGRVTDMSFDPHVSTTANVYTNVCIIKKTLLQNLVLSAVSHGYNHFGQDVLAKNLNNLRIYSYEHTGYFVCLTSLLSYYTESLKLLERENRDKLFRTADIFTKIKDSVPTKYGAMAVVKNSMIADGCQIEGTVENSIIFRGVKIGRGTVVKNSILMQGTNTGEDVKLNCVITDKSVIIKDKRVLSGCDILPFFISKNNIV